MNVCEIEYVSARALMQRKQTLLTVSGALIVMPFTQPAQAQQALQLMARRAHAPGLLLGVHDEDGVGFVNLINQTFRATRSAFFGYVAQDAFAGREWLDSALIGLGKQGVLLGFNDGKWAGSLAGFGLAQRHWAENNYQGDFFYPEYQRHFADAELTLLAMQSGRYVYEPNSLLVEIDWEKDRSQVDTKDRELFLQRQISGFDGKVSHPSLLKLFS